MRRGHLCRPADRPAQRVPLVDRCPNEIAGPNPRPRLRDWTSPTDALPAGPPVPRDRRWPESLPVLRENGAHAPPRTPAPSLVRATPATAGTRESSQTPTLNLTARSREARSALDDPASVAPTVITEAPVPGLLAPVVLFGRVPPAQKKLATPRSSRPRR